METTFHSCEVVVEAVTTPPGEDAPADAAAELGGYWFVAHETTDAGVRTGNAFRFPMAPSPANLLATTLLEHLGGTMRRTDDGELLRLVQDGDPDTGVPVNRAGRRHEARASRR